MRGNVQDERAVARACRSLFFSVPDCEERTNAMTENSKKVAVIMGSDSDLPVVGKAIDTLKALGIPVEAHVMSAHPDPGKGGGIRRGAAENGFGVIIAAAGKAAHLAGVLAAHTILPVIGIPVKSSTLDGWTPCCRRCRCRRASRSRPSAIDGRKTPPSSPHRFSPSPTGRCSRNCWIKRPIWPAVSRRRTESSPKPSAHKRDRFTA